MHGAFRFDVVLRKRILTESFSGCLIAGSRGSLKTGDPTASKLVTL
ncbi:hypothetical protein GCWU000324_03151 [Kingella oralis ATCC 51147]|uniref:Uncharacterized protein n=1 Tax=Kingella oralis ATCC 51147 TaxID=629741 RepID=C4GN63_9NEIS|nr:hypothetical protein GCWU000324_03151 [Kingella oralis ATCC 51147]